MKVMLAILLFTVSVFAQDVKKAKDSPYSFTPSFSVDMINKKSAAPEITNVDIYIQVPYTNLQFIKEGDSYLARYSGTITFYDEDKDNIIKETTWNKKLTVNSFNQASSRTNFNIELKSFELKPDDYILRIALYDEDSKKDFVLEHPVNILSFNEDVAISDIILIKEKIKTAEGTSLVPNISRYITSDLTELAFFFELYSDTNRTVQLEYSLSNKENESKITIIDTVEIGKGTNTLNYNFSNTNLSLGEYSIITKVLDLDGTELTSIGKRVFSQIYGFPASINNLDEAIEQMIYMANTDVVDELLDIEKYQDRLEGFIAFWKKKDPSKNTLENEILIEYYGRVAYANQNFKNFRKGWRSDMGMIFITLGPPNHIERHPFDSNSKPYEIWQYYDMNRQFAFIDETGFGDYRLINTNYQDWSRYRY
ncbi:MAG: GWxTD domain-containing protein [Melioribacteraceae bacterium]|nr:GWxTD domain-containing protein [Melioribacteraceae bacterium]